MNELFRRLLFLPEQGSTFALRSDGLHYWIIGVTFAVAFLIFVTGLAFVIRYRRRTAGQLTPRVVAKPWLEAVFVMVMDPQAKVVAGFEQVMPSYFGRLAPAETAALVEFIKTLRTQRLANTPSLEPAYGPVRK